MKYFFHSHTKKKTSLRNDLQKVFMGCHLGKNRKLSFAQKIMLLRNFTKRHLTWFVKKHKSTLKLSSRVDCRSLVCPLPSVTSQPFSNS